MRQRHPAGARPRPDAAPARTLVAAGLLALAASALPAAARAAEIPNFDTEAYCRMTIADGGAFAQEKYDYCIATERSARGQIGRLTSSVSDSAWNQCVSNASASRAIVPGEGSYGIFVTCLIGTAANGGRVP